MKRKHGTFFGIAVLLLMAIFTLAGCDTGTGSSTSGNGSGSGNENGSDGNGDDSGGGFSQAQKEAAKTAALEEYSDDPEGFAEFVEGMNYLKGWNLPSNPNTWSSSQWEQYYSFLAGYQNKNGMAIETAAVIYHQSVWILRNNDAYVRNNLGTGGGN
ncbi:MAG: hypothetical protein LBK83_06860 [Treponema sp.]|jgi:hypothetical protein|nr:hypothetical protein [Treponema sp.]